MKFLAAAILLPLSLLLAFPAQSQSIRDAVRSLKLSSDHRMFLRNLAVPVDLAEYMIEMPDGVRLASDVYVPNGGRDRKPTVLVRLPYGKRFYGEALHWVRLFTANDYAVVVQDMRGRHRSEGTFAPYPNEGQDGVATLDWVVKQEWAAGKVGTIGCSALGESQILLAAERHPSHAAMIPMGAGGAIGTASGLYGFFGFFEGGIMTLASGFGWFVSEGGKSRKNMWGPQVNYLQALKTLPVIGAVAAFRKDKTDFEDLLQGFDNPSIHEEWGFISDMDTFDIPSLIVDAWYDQGISSSIALSKQIGASGKPNHVLIAPSTHCLMAEPFWKGSVGDIPVDSNAAIDFDTLYLAFMDHHLKGSKAPDIANFTTYIMREDRWLESASWPPKATSSRKFYFDQAALSTTPPTRATSQSFDNDPTNPVPTLGGSICCTGDPDSRSGPLIQNSIESRDDVLKYTSDPLETPLRIAGPIKAHIQVSVDQPDSDLVVRLTDVSPDGTSVMIQEGALRLRYRYGFDEPHLLTPNQIYAVDVSLHDIAYSLPMGHQLRLLISGTSYPRLARNMNTGGNPYEESTPVTAKITVHSEPDFQSALEVFELPK